MSQVTLMGSRGDHGGGELGDSVIVNKAGALAHPGMEVLGPSVIGAASVPSGPLPSSSSSSSSGGGGILSHILIKEECKSPRVLGMDGLPSSPATRHSPNVLVQQQQQQQQVGRDPAGGGSVIVQNSMDSEKMLQQSPYATGGGGGSGSGHGFSNGHYDSVVAFASLHHHHHHHHHHQHQHHPSADSLASVASPVDDGDPMYRMGAGGDHYYREYYDSPTSDHYLSIRHLGYAHDSHLENSYVDRYVRPSAVYKVGGPGLTIDLSSPDSGIGAETAGTRDHGLSQSVITLMFRDEKEPEDEIKAWQFWHSRQHSIKQRILDVDMKNSYNLVGCIEETAHNAIAVYWNPTENVAKVSVAIHCLSTDFSSQKGVKGLPLHIQIDTYEDPRDAVVYHRGYCQIKVFCDKGAERKTRDEERRAAKRRLSLNGRKKMEDLYHPPCDRSEFYSMGDLTRQSVLFTPAADLDKLPQMELGNYYSPSESTSSPINSVESGDLSSISNLNPAAFNGLLCPGMKNTSYSLKFHNVFPHQLQGDKRLPSDHGSNGSSVDGLYFPPILKRSKPFVHPTERLMLFVKQQEETVYTPLHLVPPSTLGLLKALEVKYQILPSAVKTLYRKNRKGVIAKIDDEMLRHYCNEDTFLIDIQCVEGSSLHDITLIELPPA